MATERYRKNVISQIVDDSQDGYWS
jgi:hypothetical protein